MGARFKVAKSTKIELSRKAGGRGDSDFATNLHFAPPPRHPAPDHPSAPPPMLPPVCSLYTRARSKAPALTCGHIY